MERSAELRGMTLPRRMTSSCFRAVGIGDCGPAHKQMRSPTKYPDGIPIGRVSPGRWETMS